MKLTGVTNERAGSYLACAASILSLALAVWIGLRFFSFGVAAVALLFLAVFPADLALACRCWQDSVVALAGGLMFYLTLEISARRRSWPAYLLFAVAGSGFLLIKETAVLIYVPCVAAALWAAGVRQRDLRSAGVLLGATAAATLGALAILSYYTGGLTIALTILQTAVRTGASLPYALQMTSGPGYLLLLGLRTLSPLTIHLAALGVAIAIASRCFPRLSEIQPDLRAPREVTLLAALAGGYAAVFMVVPHWLNLRYVSPAYAPICLFAGVAVQQLYLVARRNLRPVLFRGLTALASVAIFVALLGDYARFERRIVRRGVNDLSVGLVFAANRE